MNNKEINILQIVINDFIKDKSLCEIPIEKIVPSVLHSDKNILGNTIPYIDNGNIMFKIEIASDIICKTNSTDIDESSFCKSVILHELYHVKEFLITMKSIDVFSIYNTKTANTYSMLLRLGYIQWAEYYAHYNSSKYYHSYDEIDNSVHQSEILLTVLNDMTQNDDIQLFETNYKTLEEFISKIVKLAARYNATNDIRYLKYIKPYKNHELYDNHYEYIKDIFSYMNGIYNYYPKWLNSENDFIKIGKRLFSIIHYFHITYSSVDLSDNFIFTTIK